MRLLLDAKDYTQNLNILGYALLVMLFLFFLFVNLLVFIFSFSPGENAPSLFETIPETMLAFLVTAIVFKLRGVIFKVPLRIYDEGIEFQPSLLSIRPAFVPFNDVQSIGFKHEYGLARRESAWTVHTLSSWYSRDENFHDKEEFGKFMEKATPILISHGLRLKYSRQEKGLLEFAFER